MASQKDDHIEPKLGRSRAKGKSAEKFISRVLRAASKAGPVSRPNCAVGLNSFESLHNLQARMKSLQWNIARWQIHFDHIVSSSLRMEGAEELPSNLFGHRCMQRKRWHARLGSGCNQLTVVADFPSECTNRGSQHVARWHFVPRSFSFLSDSGHVSSSTACGFIYLHAAFSSDTDRVDGI